MSIKTILECEKEQIYKWSRNRLPHMYKKWGLVLAIISFGMLLVNKFALDYAISKEVFKYGMLIGLLIISISKERIEDEWVSSLRAHSYAFAFVFGVVFALTMPLVGYGVDMFLEGEGATFKESGDFEILWILLFVQVFYFEMLKRITG